MHVVVLLRADVPAYTVARVLVDRLGFRWQRGVDRRLRVWRPEPDPGVAERTMLTVDDHRSTDRLWGGYDVAITGAFDDELLAWELFGDLRALGRPALLRQESRILLAWSPALGARSARTDRADPTLWDDYMLPPVTAPVQVAHDDPLTNLYARILADPDDDRLRLSYAQAVAGDHPDYAELIREQVTYIRDRRAGTHWDPTRATRMHDLDRALRGAALPAGARDLVGDEYHLGRGFVEAVTVRADAFVDLAPRMVAAYPLRMLHLTAVSPDRLPAVAGMPELARLRGLSLAHNPIGDGGLGALLTSPHLGRLRWLDLTRTGVTATGIEALAATGATPSLQYVLADTDLRLNPEPSFDWDTTLAHVHPATLADELGQRYEAPWLHRGERDVGGYPGYGPGYAEV